MQKILNSSDYVTLHLSVSNSTESVKPDLMINIYTVLSIWVQSGLDHLEDHSTNGPKVTYVYFEPSGQILMKLNLLKPTGYMMHQQV